MESTEDTEEAMKFYKSAGDSLNLVRLLCLTGQIDQVELPHPGLQASQSRWPTVLGPGAGYA